MYMSNEIRTDDIFLQAITERSLQILSPLINNWTYLPITNYSAGSIFYTHICNDIIINHRKYIFELCSGVSTILLARLIRKNCLNTRIISVDHDKSWQDVVYRNLQADGIHEHVSFAYSPLIEKEGEFSWYKKQDLDEFFKNENEQIDLLIVDGPPGFEKPFARFGAVPYFQKMLNSDGYSIFLHDTDRIYEQKTIMKWAEMLVDISLYQGIIYCCLTKGENLTTVPQFAV